MSRVKGKTQVIKTREPSGVEVVFVVQVSDGSVILDQAVAGSRDGYRGHFTQQEAADLGAALLMAAGCLAHSLPG
jgi:hypothetical protein